jgi:hypothetical protein
MAHDEVPESLLEAAPGRKAFAENCHGASSWQNIPRWGCHRFGLPFKWIPFWPLNKPAQKVCFDVL